MSAKWQAAASWLALVGIVSPCLAHRPSWDSGWPCSRSAVTARLGLDELPETPSTPELALIAYFSALSLTGDPAHFGSLGGEEAALSRAYGYLSNSLRKRLTMEQFRKSLTGTAAIRLLKLFSTNYGDDTDPTYVPRYFVEIEKVEERQTSQGPYSVFAYYYGFYALTKEEGSFRILSWEMKPEGFIGPLGGHQPWRYDAEARAQQCVWDKVLHFRGPVPAPVTLLERKEHFAIVRVGKETGGHSVYLARLESGEWIPLYLAARPASFAGPPLPEQRAMRIAFVRFQEGGSEICTMGGDGSQLTRLTGGPGRYSDPSWSPDGGKIAFVSDQTGNQDIYLMDADGSNLRKLTTGPANEHSPAWSPDGTRVAFVVQSDESDHRGLYLADLHGATPRKLTPAGMWAFCPWWSRDGKRILFRSGRQLWAINADGSNLERLAWVGEWDEEAAFSSDGQRAALVRLSPDEGSWDIYVTDLERNDLRRITFDGFEKHAPSWVTQNLLLFRMHKEDLDQLYWLDLSSGGMTPVSPDQEMQLEGAAVMLR